MPPEEGKRCDVQSSIVRLGVVFRSCVKSVKRREQTSTAPNCAKFKFLRVFVLVDIRLQPHEEKTNAELRSDFVQLQSHDVVSDPVLSGRCLDVSLHLSSRLTLKTRV